MSAAQVPSRSSHAPTSFAAAAADSDPGSPVATRSTPSPRPISRACSPTEVAASADRRNCSMSACTRSIQVPLSPRAPRSPAPVQTVTIVRVSPSSQDNPLACRLYVKPDGSDLDLVLIGPILAGLSSPRRGLAATGLILAAILEQREENHRPWRRPSTHRPGPPPSERQTDRRRERGDSTGAGRGQLVRAQRPPGHRRDHRVLTRRWRPRPAAAGGGAAR